MSKSKSLSRNLRQPRRQLPPESIVPRSAKFTNQMITIYAFVHNQSIQILL